MLVSRTTTRSGTMKDADIHSPAIVKRRAFPRQQHQLPQRFDWKPSRSSLSVARALSLVSLDEWSTS